MKTRATDTSRAVYHSDDLRRLAKTEQGRILTELAKHEDMTILELEHATGIPSSTVSARLDELRKAGQVFTDYVIKRACRINGIKKIRHRLATPDDRVQRSLFERKVS